MTDASAATAAIRVLLVDDHELVRRGLRLILEGQEGPRVQVVGEAGGAARALELAEREQPDIILLDLDLGGEDGLDLLPRLLDATARSRVIVLTGATDPEALRRAALDGAMGIIIKDMSHALLLKAVEKVHEGEIWIDRALMGRLQEEKRRRRPGQLPDPEGAKIAKLTQRQREVIAQIGEGLTNKEIASRLGVSETTVRHHLTAIFTQLELSNRLELIIYAYRHGLATPPK